MVILGLMQAGHVPPPASNFYGLQIEQSGYALPTMAFGLLIMATSLLGFCICKYGIQTYFALPFGIITLGMAVVLIVLGTLAISSGTLLTEEAFRAPACEK